VVAVLSLFLYCGKFRANIVVVFDIVLRCGSWCCGKLLTNMVYLVAIAVVGDNGSCGDPKTLTPQIAVMHLFFKILW